MFESILMQGSEAISMESAMLCTGAALLLGIMISAAYMYCGSYTKNFAISLAILPAMVQVVILMVNGNLGTSVAVLGAFGLIRFRSVPGSSREITTIFLAMAAGLATGTGYIAFAALFTFILCAYMMVLYKSGFGNPNPRFQELKVTIPENLDYRKVFDDIFEAYALSFTLERVKTVNLGSMYELCYRLSLKDEEQEKAMIDEIRCRNGNLNVILNRTQTVREEL